MNSEAPVSIRPALVMDSMEDDAPDSESRSIPFGEIAQITVSWLLVGLPLAYGLYETILRAAKLFTG